MFDFRFQERKMTRQEAVELISRKLNGQVTSELLSSSSSVGINRSESVSMKMSSSIGTESNSNSLMTNNAGLPLLNISFVVQEREKLANWKKRYENQACDITLICVKCEHGSNLITMNFYVH